jgi:hypothetical protein
MKKLFFLLTVFGWTLMCFGQVNDYNSRDDLPDDFPIPEILYSNDPSPGYFFLSPAGLWGYFPDATPYLAIIDNNGTPVFYEEQTAAAFDFKLQNDNMLTFASGTLGRNHYVLNEKFEFIEELVVNGFSNDFHDLIILENGNYLMLANEYRIVDMDTVVEGGQPGVTVVGGVIQIQDVNKEVLFHWSTFDHFQITDAGDHIDLTSPYSIDYAHINSIELDTDSTIIISSRNLHELTKININTGEIIWRLGGKNNMFTFNSDTSIFSGQHDFRKLPNGQYSVYDNNWFSGVEGSRALIYDLDELNYTATLLTQYKSYPELIQGNIMGNSQLLPNGNWIVGWGSGDPNVTEFKPDGSKALEIAYDAVSYRAFKFDWKSTAITSNVDTVNFGDVSISHPSTTSVELTNNLQQTIEINNIHQHGSRFSVNNQLPILIEANSHVNIELQFDPNGAEGFFNDLMTLSWDTENEGLSRRISVQIPLQANALAGTSIQDEDLQKVQVFPNPFTEKIVISTNKTLKNGLDIRILNATGQIIYVKSIDNMGRFEISTAELPGGIYQVQLISGQKTLTKKIIKF